MPAERLPNMRQGALPEWDETAPRQWVRGKRAVGSGA